MDIKNIDFDVKEVEEMVGMFQNCYSLINLNLSQFNTTKVTSIDFMFSDCHNLENLSLDTFNTLSCNSFNNTFDNCTKLEVTLNPDYCINLYPHIPEYVHIKNITNDIGNFDF